MKQKTSSQPSESFGFLNEPSLRVVMKVLEQNGGSYVVGGAVRNSLMGLEPKDIDLATPIPPHKVEELFVSKGFKVVPTGIEHGTVTVISGDTPYEITTFRKEVALGTGPGGRSAAVTWAETIEEDAIRRDLTMNALYVDIYGNLIDVVGGLQDIRNGVVRFVGDPAERLKEDRLRALRFFRFWANYGAPDARNHQDAIDAIRSFVGKFSVVSKERIGAEMRNLLGARNPVTPVATLRDIKLLEEIAPSVNPDKLLEALCSPKVRNNGWLTVLANCAGGDIKSDWKLSNSEARVIDLIKKATNEDHDVRRGYVFGEDVATAAGSLRELNGHPLPSYERVKHGSLAVFPLCAADFPELSGKELGMALNKAKQFWLSQDASLTKEELLEGSDLDSTPGL